MPTQIQVRRGTTAQNDAFTGAVGEVTADTQVHTLRVHDGSQVGGYELALANLSNATFGSGVATFLATPSSANLAAAVTGETGTGALVFATSPTLVTPALGTPASGIMTNVSGTAASLTAGTVTTNANLTGGVTSVGNAATVVTNANLTGGVTSVGNAATVVTNANLTGGVTSVGNAATVVTNANLTGHVTSVGNAAILGSFTSAQLATALTDETGSGANVFGTSPSITTSLTTGSASFDLVNTTATTVNFAKAATTLSIGASSGTTTINNALTVTGNLTVSGTTTTVDSTTVNIQNAFVFEGATADAYETTLTVVDPTVDNTITLPDASGTVALTSATTLSSLSSVGTITTGTWSGTTIAVNKGGTGITSLGTGVATWLGTPSSANLATAVTDETGIGSLVFGTNPILTAPTILTGVYFEGATDDAYETLLTVVDPTVDNTITLPNVTGTVITTGDTGTVTSTMLAGSIANAKLSNSSTTVGSTAIALGASSTTLAGLTSVTSTGFTGALTGNASTATALATPRAINGTNFDGSAAITVTAAAGTLTGATLASNVLASSLTSVGTLSAGAVPASLVTAGTFGAGAYTFPGALAITGALTGVTTGAFSGQVTLSATDSALQRFGNTTNACYQEWRNTSGYLQMGVERSIGGGLITGSTGYAGCLTTVGTVLQLGGNQSLALTLTGTAAQFAGTLGVTGVTSLSQRIEMTTASAGDNYVKFTSGTASTYVGVANGFTGAYTDADIAVRSITGKIVFLNNITAALTIASTGAATFSSTLDVTGAFTGATTGAFSGKITSTVGNNAIYFESASASTGYHYTQIKNTGAWMIFGIEGSTPSSLATNDTAYSTVLVTQNATDLILGTNQTMNLKIASGGAATFSSTVQTTGLGVGTAPSATAGEIRATNNVTAYYSSDSRLKENVLPIPDALHKIKQLQGVEFDWTQEYITAHGGEDDLFMRRHDVGVIAQDVEKVLPEVVATRPDGYLAVRYEKLVPLLLQAIKELSAQVDELSKDK